MRHPLLTLWRHQTQVIFFDAEGLPAGLAQDTDAAPLHSGEGGLQRHHFSRVEQARTWLQFWRGDPSASSDLHWLAQRLRWPGSMSPAQGSTQRLEHLAQALWRGDLIAAEPTLRPVPAGRLALAPTGAGASAKGGGAGGLAGLSALSTLPAVPVLPPLLPALESARIQGAQVLPEIQQSLAQIDASLQGLDSTGASLTPAPDAVPAVKTEMQARSAAVRDTLDRL